jgi:hypothetical protein
MKTLRFLFVAVLLTCIVGVTQTNAQAEIYRGQEVKDVYYEIDGVQYGAYANVDYQFVITPSGHFKWVATGDIVEAYEYVPGEGWVLLDHIQLPKKTVIYYDPLVNDEKVTITPSGKVKVVVLIKDAPWL